MSFISRIAETYTEKTLSADELSLYARHLLLPGIGTIGQLKLKMARVLVVGAGGLGCPVLQALAGAGVGTLTVMDPDVVDRSNLARQWLHSHDDIGKNKALSAAEELGWLNPHIEVVALPEAFDRTNASELVEAHDIVVDGTDDFQARRCIDEVCSEVDRPWVHAALYRERFQVAVFWAKYGVRYVDLFPQVGEAPDCAGAGVLGATAALAANCQAWEVTKLITATEDVELGTLVSVRAPSYEVSKFGLPDASTLKRIQYETTIEDSFGWTFDRLNQALSIHEPIDLVYLDGDASTRADWKDAKAMSSNSILEKPSLIPYDRRVCLICETGLASGMLAEALNAMPREKAVVHLIRE